MSRFSILSLPSECIYEIGLQLEEKDNLRLCLVCRHISHSIEPLVLHKVYLDIGIHSFQGTRQQLMHIASQPTKLARYARTLKIVNSSGRPPCTDKFTPEELDSFKSLFPVTMASLKNVERLIWWTNGADSEEIISMIFTYIKTGPILDVGLDCFDGCPDEFPAHLANITSLEAFSLWNMYYTGYHSSEVAISVSKLIAQSPQLTHLEFDSGFYLANTSAPSLHTILPSEDGPPLPLQSLSLRCMRILLDTSTLHHLRSLQSLSIHFNLTTPTLGSHLPEIWDTLKRESIHLSKIDVNLTEVEDALLDYLLSYDGIRNIKFDNHALLWSDQRTVDKFARRFYKDVLPKVAPSLRVLHVEASSPSAWCFGKWNSASIALCTRLEQLTVSIVDLIQTHSEDTLALLDQIIPAFPNMRRLRKINVPFVPQIG